MCGIVGFIDLNQQTNEDILNKMRDTLSHRGPDASKSSLFKNSNFIAGFGHRRLSILDLSSLGTQPMIFENLTIVHNGEVYNFEEIRKELEQNEYSFVSNTDTEVILKAFHKWGVKAVDKFRGMFAFSIYDKNAKKIYIFRDRAGIKPLYYYKSEKIFLFGSELKALHAHPLFKRIINRKALPYYFRFGYIPAPLSIFENTYKLQAGHYLVINCKNNHYEEIKYWSVESHYQQEKSTQTEEEILNELEKILIDAFKLRMVSDVPVGVFLSGGVDSSLVTALLQKNSSSPLKTFTIGFKEKAYNEANHAQEIADYLGTNHTEYYCTQQDMLEVIKELPMMYDEPFGDSSAIPTYLVSKLAKEQVSVVLSGDGGDESFIGYSKYFAIQKVAKILESPLKKKLLQGTTQLIDSQKVEQLNNLLPPSKRQKNIKDKYQKFKNAIHSDNLAMMFVNASSYVDTETLNAILSDTQIDFSKTGFDVQENLSILDYMGCVDYQTFMADDVLTKVDRATMSLGLEAREPLLDHKIIEFSAKIPDQIKYKNHTGKYLLKNILYRYLPKKMIERPKTGFQIPLYEWLQSDLKELLEFYLTPERLSSLNLFNINKILEIKADLYKGKEVNLSVLWFILMFEMWREKWKV